MSKQKKNNNLFKVISIFVASFLMFVYVFPWHNFGIDMPFKSKDYRLGLDLQGGVELDYKVDLEEYRKKQDYSKNKEKEVIEGLKSIIDKRIESLNINDSELNDASYGGEKHIIVQIPLKGNSSFENAKNIEKAKEAIGKVVKIVFKERRTKITQEDKKARKEIAEKALAEVKKGEKFSVISDKYKLNYPNVFVGNVSSFSGIIEGNGALVEKKLNEAKNLGSGEEGYLLYSQNKDKNYEYIFINKKPSERKPVMDSKGRILNDKYFVKSGVGTDGANNNYVISLLFNSDGADIFSEITGRLVGQQMAIFVGGEMLTDPVIQQKITGGRAQITGQRSFDEAKKLSQDINTGVVPAPIYLTSEKTIDSKIGTSSLQKLIIAGVSGLFLIFLFLVIVYRSAGFMASLALLFYALIILFILKLLGVVLTLASIAGLILSFGMAIDANVLIFERIKSELEKGEDIKKATELGFSKTWSAIWDSNLTGIITAIILFIFGINMIKGFGLILGIGIVISFFTAMVISRIFLEFLYFHTKSKRIFIGFKK